MRKIIIGVIAMLGCVVTPASAKLKEYENVEGWRIYSDDRDCTMVASYARHGDLAFDYDYAIGKVTLRFAVKDTQSLKTGDVRLIETMFANDTPSSVDTGWGTDRFVAYVLNGETHLTSRFDQQFLIDVARYNTLAFFYNEKLINSYVLTGTKAAVASLIKCAKTRAVKTDPFADDDSTLIRS